MRPLTGTVIIRPSPVEQKQGSIIIGYQEGQSPLLRPIFPFSGEVISVGPGSGFSPGQNVVYQRWGTREIGEFLVVSEKDVVAILE